MWLMPFIKMLQMEIPTQRDMHRTLETVYVSSKAQANFLTLILADLIITGGLDSP